MNIHTPLQKLLNQALDELFLSPLPSPVKDKVELDPDYVASSQSSQSSTAPSEITENLNSKSKSRLEPVTLAGDGRCDSPGHSAKYSTYTMLDVETDLVVDFKVVSVCEVKNLNAMEKKGFIETLNFIEAAGVDVAGISTDSHPQIKKYMQEEQKQKLRDSKASTECNF